MLKVSIHPTYHQTLVFTFDFGAMLDGARYIGFVGFVSYRGDLDYQAMLAREKIKAELERAIISNESIPTPLKKALAFAESKKWIREADIVSVLSRDQVGVH